MQVVVDSRASVSRSVVALVTLPALLCVTAIVFVLTKVTIVEFAYAIGVSDNKFLPELAQLYRAGYFWGWAVPIIGAVGVIALMFRKKCPLGVLVCYINCVVLFTTVWLLFAGCAFYLANQSLWGWRRVIVDGDVFVDKGFWPGQVPLVQGGDDVLPGELIRGKWDAARKVLRRVGRTYNTERGADVGAGQVPERSSNNGSDISDFPREGERKANSE